MHGTSLVSYCKFHAAESLLLPRSAPIPQDRGHKELGSAARFKHLVYVLVMLGLGLVWTSDSQVGAGPGVDLTLSNETIPPYFAHSALPCMRLYPVQQAPLRAVLPPMF